MSLYQNEEDKIILQTIFPQYLLQQPVEKELKMLYYQNKKMFSTFNSKEYKNITEQAEKSFQGKISKNEDSIIKLPHSVRKEIWTKLMKLGLLGTISFDKASDKYLMQVYRYFYPDSLYQSLGLHDFSKSVITAYEKPDVTSTKPEFEKMNSGEYLSQPNEQSDDDSAEVMEEDFAETEGENEEEPQDVSGSAISEESESSSNTGEDVNDHGNGENLSDEINMNELEGHSEILADKSGFLSSKPSTLEIVRIYSESTRSQGSSKSKFNNTPVEFYQLIHYFLPNRWLVQPSTPIILTKDGVTRLGNSALGSSSTSSTQTSIRVTRNKSASKNINDYAITWANNPISSSKVGIFYFEIKILSLKKIENESNVIVGFKDWNRVINVDMNNTENTTQRARVFSESDSNTRTSTNSFPDRNRIHSPENSKNDSWDGIYGICAIDGTVLATKNTPITTPFTVDQTIGCGINFIDGTIFFTKNGLYLGSGYKNIKDVELVPYIAIKPGTEVRTNFGLYDHFIFDIVGFQDHWKSRGYKEIFSDDNFTKSITKSESSTDKNGLIKNNSLQSIDRDVDMELSNYNEFETNFHIKDTRLIDGELIKPETEKINHLNLKDDTLQSTLKTVINEYLVHEGLIDVAKGFLDDLKKNTVSEVKGFDLVDKNTEVIKYNEKRIIMEENNLKTRQKIRRLINDGNIRACMDLINDNFYGLLDKDIILHFELQVALYLNIILESSKSSIIEIIELGRELTNEFIHDDSIPLDLKPNFKNTLDDISRLLVYEDPIKDAPAELSKYLSKEYLNDRIFQIVNRSILYFLDKGNEDSLGNIIRYTRTMLQTMSEQNTTNQRLDDKAKDDQNIEGSDTSNCKYYKLINVDDDLLNF